MTASTSAKAGATSRASFAANVLLAAVSLGVSLGLLAGIEGGLRLAGVGGPDPARTSRLGYQQIWFPTLEPAWLRDGTGVLRTVDPRLGHQWILREKPAAAVRIVSFGGSATAGLGFSQNGSFSRELERLLVAAHPDRRIEVLNLGIVGLATKQMKLLVAEAARELEPDLLVVYAGNNEFLEAHAEKYAAATATPLSRIGTQLAELHLYRAVRNLVRRPRRDVSMPERELANEAIRASQDEIIKYVSMTDAEVTEVVDQYERNLEQMVDAARQAGVRILLCTVASNWEWRGRSDLPADWLDARLGKPGPATRERLLEARARLTELLAASPRDERYELLHERAQVERMLGDVDAARADFRASMNADPHLRRALDIGNERVRRVASRRGVALFDAVELLAKQSPDGIVGFDEFYDYVHFTPRGNVKVAAGLFEAVVELGVVPPAPGFDLAAAAAARVAEVEALRADPFPVREWLGFGFERAAIHDRDLWKYDRMLRALDERIARDPGDVAALVYRGNASYFRPDGGPAAARDWRAALALAPGDPGIRANLALLEAEDRLLAPEGPTDTPSVASGPPPAP